jgi:hypothetical protein
VAGLLLAITQRVALDPTLGRSGAVRDVVERHALPRTVRRTPWA